MAVEGHLKKSIFTTIDMEVMSSWGRSIIEAIVAYSSLAITENVAV